MDLRRALLVAALLAPASMLVGARDVRAAESTRVRFDVEAPCTSPDDFARRVAERTALVTAGEDAREAVEVIIRDGGPGASGAVGTFRVVPSEGEPSSERRMDGDTCEEVADALSLAVALAFDPEATVSRRPAPLEPAPAPPSTPPTSVQARIAASAAPPPIPAPALRASVGVHASVAGARALPHGAFGFGEIAGRRAAVRLAFGAQRVAVAAASRDAELTWGLVVPDVCPYRLISAPVELSPCMGIALGIVSAESSVPGAASFTRAWIAPKPALRARLDLSGAVAFEAQLALEVPLVRSRYTFGSVTAYETPVVVPSLGLGVVFTP